MKTPSSQNKPLKDFLLFSGRIFFSIVFSVILITLKNECNYLKNEVYHLENIKISHIDRLKVLSGKVNNLSRRDRIEKIAFENFKLHVPSPESLIVYIGD